MVLAVGVTGVRSQDIVHYSGTAISNVDYHHGQLAPAVGVHNIQVFRANREHPELAEGSGWTYNHAPMLAYWNKTFYLEYLSDSIGESVPPGQTLLVTSPDGYSWSKPAVLFPPYRVPDGTTKEGHPGIAKGLFAVMHQRMGFYVSKQHRLLALGFYGLCLDPHDDPNDGKGIGRVVREIHADGSWGPVYFLHYNPAWNPANTSYPFYTSSRDKGFIQDCNELMATPLMMMQWVEETDRKDPLIPLHKDYKAFNFYHLPDGRTVGLWKNALTGISKDEGRSWSAVTRAPHFVNSNAKIWGQRTSDGRYAVVYNPSEFRWPLAISTSKDGLDYTDLLLVQGEISTARYGGNYKSYGPQYTRGIEEGNGVPPDGNIWITYSMNKEDIWVGTIPVPVTDKVETDVNDVFDELPAGKELQWWNVYSPMWAPVSIGKTAAGARCLVLKDEDPYDFAKVERVFPVSRKMRAEFAITPAQADHGQLQIEFQDEKNAPAMRLSFEPDGSFIAKAGARTKSMLKYAAGETYIIRVALDMDTRMYTVNINGKDVLTQLFFAPVQSFGHIVFRTGEARHYPTAESPAEETEDKPHAGDKTSAATFTIHYLKTTGVAVLPAAEQQRAVSAVAVKDVGGFVGGRLEKNMQNYIKKFPIDDYIRMVEGRRFTAWDWRQGEQPGKWLESAILTAMRTHDVGLMKEARDMYQRVLRSQAADGYVGITSDSVRTVEKPLRGMDAYELYFLQHALLTAYEIWKDPKGLRAAKRLGDYFLDHIAPGKAEFWPSPMHYPDNKGKVLKGTMHSDIAGHSIHYSWEGTLLIDPMMRLYQLTHDRRYFDWCKWVVGNIDQWSGWDAYSNLDKVASGEMGIDKIQPYVHTHTFQMNFLGLLRMYEVSGDTSYLRKVVGAWNDIAARQLYITGGVSVGEHYEREYIKPLTGEMMETCATMSWIQLSEYLLELTGDVKYADVIERIVWNQVFAEQAIDGDAHRYFTPPNGYTPKGYYREPDCCMGSGHRLLSMLPGFIYAMGAGGAKGAPGGEAIYINQFIPSAVTLGRVKLRQETGYPQEGRVVITVDPAVGSNFVINVRIPSWCVAPVLAVNGVAVAGVQAGHYAVIRRLWHPGDRITLDLPMALQWVRHEHYLKTADRKPYKTSPDDDAPYALVRGPVVYAVDDIWYKGDTADFSKGWMDSVRYILSDPGSFRQVAAAGEDILGPGYEVSLRLRDGRVAALPVYPFANIGKWYRDAAHKPDSNAAAWGYAIWLKGVAPVALSLPKIFGDNMVLQRGVPVPVWGMASAGAVVTVEFGAQRRQATADGQGRWKVELDPLVASASPAEMTVTDEAGESVRFKNVLVGEVWLCSGQSNMEYSMRKNSKFEKAAHGAGPENELERANNPDIRIFLVRTNYSKPDELNIRRAWDTAAGAPLRDFSAPGYFFAKELYQRLHVPIGVIANAVPGSAIEPFLPDTGKFYQTMVKPLAPYALRGFCWYQGETNCFLNDTIRYAAKMKTLINSWRQLWEKDSLSFYFVQIAPYHYSHSTGGAQTHTPESEPAFWAAQEKALVLPHTGMVVTSDLVDSLQDLHPAYKWEIGRRLALWALAKDYGQGVICSGPVYNSAVVKGRRVAIVFGETGSGLTSRDGQAPDWFEIAGADGKFVRARAAIEGKDTVIVTAKGVRKPTGVRFGWNEAAQPNLYNKEGLPAMPFRVLQF